MEILLAVLITLLVDTVFYYRKHKAVINRYKEAVYVMSKLKIYGGLSPRTAARLYNDIDAIVQNNSRDFLNCPHCGFPFLPAWGCSCRNQVDCENHDKTTDIS